MSVALLEWSVLIAQLLLGIAMIAGLIAFLIASWLTKGSRQYAVPPFALWTMPKGSVLGALRGETGNTCTRRFWQWNRYTPVPTSNAAMRDGNWKLVRPTIRETMHLSQADLDMDHGLKYEPDRYPDICRDPEPERAIPDPEAPLFNSGLGLDSIDALELALAVGKRYGFQLRSDSEENRRIFASLRALSAHVEQNKAA